MVSSIPEHAMKMVDSIISQTIEDNSRTIFLVGSKNAGKSTLLYSFLDKTDAPRETLVLEYSFGRKSKQGQEIDKTLCHIWEYGGKLHTLKSALSSIPVREKYFFCVMVDLSKIKNIWDTLETCLRTIRDVYSEGKYPEVIIIGGKYDIFKNYDGEVKKIIYTTFRSLAILNNAHVIFYSNKDQQLMRRAKEMLHNIGFGNGVPIKEKSTNFTKPLLIPKGSDSWESVGIAPSTLEQVKIRHLSRIASDSEAAAEVISTSTKLHAHAEPALDEIATLEYSEIRNMATLIDDQVNDYLLSLR